MIVYSIKDIEEITGIKAHTLRIWEKRYNVIVPKRTKTNIRYYSEDQLKHILNVAFLNKEGYKISRIAKLSDKELMQEVALLTKTENNIDLLLDGLTLAVINMDEKSVNRILDKYIEQLGFEETMNILINPFLEKLSVLWISGSIKAVHEIFISQMLKQKAIVQIDSLEYPSSKNKTLVMLYLPEGEKQELSLLYFEYLLKKNNIPSVYIGADLSIKDVLDAYNCLSPSHLYTMINENITNQSFDAYLKYLCENICPSHLLISGFKPVGVKSELPDNCTVITELDAALTFFTA